MQKILFADFQLDLDAFELTRKGVAIPIGRRCMDLLVCLIENRDRFVSTNLLRANVWHNAKLSPAAIPTCVRELRRMLGDDAFNSRIIASKKSRGYRFIAHAEFLRGESADLKNSVTELPFVGRTPELGVLRRAHRAITARRQGQLIVLRGEAGIGKSRLLEEFLRTTPSSIHRVALRCRGAGFAPPFSLWIDLFEEMASARNDHDSQGLLGTLKPSPTNKIPSNGTHTSEQKVETRHATFSRWTAAIRELMRGEPLILAIEDIHVGDPDSLHLIAWVADALHSLPLLLIATQRPRAVSRSVGIGIDDITAIEHCETVDIQPLTSDQITEILRPQLLHEFVAATDLRASTGGNPLLISHAIRSLAVSSHPIDTHLAQSQAIARNAVVVARVASDLPSETRELLSMSALVGQGFSSDLIAHITDISPAEANALLEPAARARLLHESGSQYEFSHTLLREALASTLDPMDKKALHARIASYLISKADSSASTRAIATHLALATPHISYAEAIKYCTLAYHEANAQFAYADAKGFAEKAVELCLLDSSTTTENRCRLLINLAKSQEFLGERKSARSLLLEVVRVARTAGPSDLIVECALALSQDFASIDVGIHDMVIERLLREAIEATPQNQFALRARLTARLSQALRWSDSFDHQESLAKESLAIATQSRDSGAIREALSALTESLHGPEKAPDRLEALCRLENMDISNEDSGSTLLQHTKTITALLEMGLIERVATVNEAYRELAEKTGQAHHLWYAITTDTMRSLMSGKMSLPEELEIYFKAISKTGDIPNVIQGYAVQRFFREVECGFSLEVLPLLKQIIDRFPLVSSWGSALTWLHWDMGNRDECLRHLAHFTPERIHAMRRQVGSGAGLAMISEVCAHVGPPTLCKYLLDILQPLKDRCATAGYGVLYLGTFARHAGLLARSIGQHKRAVDLLKMSVEQEASRGADLWRGYALVDLAITIGCVKGAKNDARAALEDAERIGRAIRVPRLSRRISEANAKLL